MKRKYFLTLATAAWLGAQTRAVFCQTPEERAGARAAADQGYDAFERGDWASALDLFGRAESLVHSPVHQLYLARSNAQLDRLIEAQEAYLRVLRDPLPESAAAAAKQARHDAERELGQIEPRIPFVTLNVEGADGSEIVEVTQDGRVLPAALIGVARPLNPGQHSWQARSGSRRSPAVTRLVQPGTKTTLHLRLPEAEIELVPRQQPTSTPAAVLAAEPAPSGGPSAWVYVGFGVAAAGLAVGTGFLLQQGNIEDEILATCMPDCLATPENRARLSDADRAGLISAIGFTAGGVGLAGALTLWMLAPEASSSVRAGSGLQRVQPWVGWGSAGVSGSF